jgi:hypothetical protein
LLDSEGKRHQSAPSNQTRHLLTALYKAAKKTPNHYILTLKTATRMFTETLYNSQHSTRLIPESRSCTLGSQFADCAFPVLCGLGQALCQMVLQADSVIIIAKSFYFPFIEWLEVGRKR